MSIEGKTVEELRELNWRGMLRRHDIPEYDVWRTMKRRCIDLNRRNYHDYGGRGISVCSEWQAKFWAWFEHIGRRPVDGLTQERIDNDKGYQPGNVKWDTQRAQNENRRPRTIQGKTSRFRGVSARGKKWIAYLSLADNPGGRCYQLYIGVFHTEVEAAIAYNDKVANLGLGLELNEIAGAE
jgi:hypothetical protein